MTRNNRIVYLAWANDGAGHVELVGVYSNEVDAYQSLSIYCNTQSPRWEYRKASLNNTGMQDVPYRVWAERREVE